ncbi:MAG TPA: tRNA (adenosine(37)-N6)-threonylcarbamoyltransferase complex ATPase subunit type 1 TsaE [Phycisphaerae bacterium]|nr:tRNA (adenosine(37)-N6)-threonylcarbamoyltransferase complex ATPase subunit type 1 TsaE [Phycisphaerae bacterium]
MTAPPCVVHSDSVDQTRRLGQRMGAALAGGEVIALVGPLGAGKTQFVKGLAVGNGQADPSRVTSPTFVLVNEYSGRIYVYHVDAYRLGGSGELVALGFDEMISPASCVVLEWADRVEGVLPEDCLTIRFEPTGETSRRLTMDAGGPSSQRLLDSIRDDARRARQPE